MLSADTGIGYLQAFNATHLTWSFHASVDGSIQDEFTIVKQP